MNIDLALTLLLAVINRGAEISAAIQKARSEGRDLSEAELDAFVAADDVARLELQRAIAAKKQQDG